MPAPLPHVDLLATLDALVDGPVDVVRAALAPLPSASLLVVGADLRLRLAEGRGVQAAGYATRVVRGRRVEDLLPAAAAARLVPELRAVLTGERRSFCGEVLGDGRSYDVACGPLLDATGAPRGASCLLVDATDRIAGARRTEAELERRLAQAAALGRLGEHAVASHDLLQLADLAGGELMRLLGVDAVALLERCKTDAVVRAGTGLAADAAGVPYELEDGALDACPPALAAAGVVTAVHVPIGDPAAPRAMLGVYATAERDVDAGDREFLRAVAHVLGGVIARHRAEEGARHDALHDTLTGLPNRTLLVDRLAQALRRRTHGRTAVLLLDLDDFKLVNDSFGHAAGDVVLGAIGPRLAGALRTGDTVARFGGDTFGVVCEDVADAAQARHVAERLIGAFATPFVVDGEQVFVTPSVGVAVGGRGDLADDLVRDADTALYRARDAGAGRYELFDPRLRERAVARLRVESELRRALTHGELRVFYQPYWSLPDRRLAGAEALVRWEHPERGLVPPGEFIPVAEESGLVVPLGTWVLREACRQLGAWQRTQVSARELRIRVNLSARQVTHPGLLGVVGSALADHDVDPALLGLEITEGLLLRDSDAVAATLGGLKELGVSLVLDDFGTGYSSLSYLKRFPLDQLKIDRSFVSGLEEREEDLAIVRAIVGMAQALGLGVVPEGVETEGQLAALTDLGCEFAQGFLLGRPVPADGLTSLL